MQQPNNPLVLAIAPSTKGFGFAVLEGGALVDWGFKTVPDHKNARCLLKAESIIAHYQPDVLVLEDLARSKRGPRIRILIRDIIDLAPKHHVGVKLFSRSQVYETFFAGGKGTKEALAEVLVKQFPDELGPKLPPERRDWMSEDPRLAIFDAVALGLMVVSSKWLNSG